jgi:hypothetical protein
MTMLRANAVKAELGVGLLATKCDAPSQWAWYATPVPGPQAKFRLCVGSHRRGRGQVKS